MPQLFHVEQLRFQPGPQRCYESVPIYPVCVMPLGCYPRLHCAWENSMNDKLHQPVYCAAIDMARADLREIAELIDQLRARQEQLCSAVEALELVVGSADQPAEARPAAKPVYEINSRNSQTAQSSQRVI